MSYMLFHNAIAQGQQNQDYTVQVCFSIGTYFLFQLVECMCTANGAFFCVVCLYEYINVLMAFSAVFLFKSFFFFNITLIQPFKLFRKLYNIFSETLLHSSSMPSPFYFHFAPPPPTLLLSRYPLPTSLFCRGEHRSHYAAAG